MKDPQMDTIDQLRSMVKDLQAKLEYRTQMLADILPHLVESVEAITIIDEYIAREWFERHSASVARFKEEYANEVQQNKDGKL